MKEIVQPIGHRAQIWSTIQKIKSGSVYVCFNCSEQFQSLDGLSNHLRLVHRLTSRSEYKCVHCEGYFQRHAYLYHYRHIFKIHRNIFASVINEQPDFEMPEVHQLIENVESIHPIKNTLSYSQSCSKELQVMASKLLASILQSGKIPLSSSDAIVYQAKQLISKTVIVAKNIVSEIICSTLTEKDKLRELDRLDLLLNPFEDIDSKHKFDNYLLNNGFMIPSKEIVLDTDIFFRRGSDSIRKQVYKPITMQYVPIKDSLLQLLKIPGFYSILEFNKSYNGDIFSSFREGMFFKDENFPINVIFINIFYDDAEMANPLGSKAGRHKIANFYFTIQDLPEHMQSSLENIILLASVKSNDLKIAGANAVMQIVVDELLDLWENGIEFELDGHRINIKVALSQISGDNLGIHALLGYSEGFTANYPCRRCKLHRNECHKVHSEDESKLRDISNYNEDLTIDNFSLTGINFKSVINNLPYHHVTKMFVFDIMHDFFEGVGPDLIIHLVNNCISKKYFNLDKLNYRLESFD
jgi:hypothetical protein